jgi:hypothetical protein
VGVGVGIDAGIGATPATTGGTVGTNTGGTVGTNTGVPSGVAVIIPDGSFVTSSVLPVSFPAFLVSPCALLVERKYQ